MGELLIQRRDPCPVRLLRGARPRVAGGDGGLECVGASGAAELPGPFERRETPADEQLIPACTVLVEQKDGLSRRADAGPGARGLDLQKGDQAVDLGLP